MDAAGSNICVIPREKQPYFLISVGTWYWLTRHPKMSADGRVQISKTEVSVEIYQGNEGT